MLFCKKRNTKEVLMPELKTKANFTSVQTFLDGVTDLQRRKDSFAVVTLMQQVTGAEPQMWGEHIVGFGTCRYRYPNGREIDWMKIGFSPRKHNLTFYLTGGLHPHMELIGPLGKVKIAGSCLHITKLEDIDLTALERLLRTAVADL
jgi:hypothetical protein